MNLAKNIVKFFVWKFFNSSKRKLTTCDQMVPRGTEAT